MNNEKYRELLYSYKYLVLGSNKIKGKFPSYWECLTLLKSFREKLLEKIDVSILDNFLIDYNLSIEPEDDPTMYALLAIEHYNKFVCTLQGDIEKDLVIFGSDFLRQIALCFSIKYDLPYWVLNKPKW